MVSLERLRSAMRTRVLEASQRLESLIRHRQLHRPSGPQEAQIIADLKTEGVHVTTIDRLFPSSAAPIRNAFASATALLEESPGQEASLWNRHESSTDLRAEVLLTRVPELYLLGLDGDLLTLIHHYLRLPVAYHGAVIRHSLVDGAGAGPRLWHKDAEDFHVFRMVVYLNEVTDGGGPFEYIPRNLGISYKHFVGGGGELTNDRVREVVPPAQWKRVYGPAGTVVLADTAQIFHHEALQTQRERSVIMLGYSSRRPRSPQLALAHFPVERVQSILVPVVPPGRHEYCIRLASPSDRCIIEDCECRPCRGGVSRYLRARPTCGAVFRYMPACMWLAQDSIGVSNMRQSMRAAFRWAATERP